MARSWMHNVVGTAMLFALCGGLLACDVGGEMAILDVDPKVGHTQGEQYVKILGQNFRQDIGYTVYFGTKKSKQVTILDPETILVSTPASMSVGSVDIMVRADDGNAWRITDGFKFEDMGGSVVEGLGSGTAGDKEKKGNLAF